jgi:Bacterial protein of unknown function (DUF948)
MLAPVTAAMTAGDFAAVVVAIVSVVVMVGLVVTLVSLTRTLGSLRVAVEDLRQTTVPLVNDMHATVRRATSELERVDTLLGTAESISTTVDSASRLAYLTFSNPVIKALAFATGTGRAFRRLRRER